MSEETFVIGPSTKKLSPKDISWEDIRLKNIDELIFTFYYDAKNHRYRISINYGEAYVTVTEKRGEAIFEFLSIVAKLLEKRRNLRAPDDEETFDDQEDEEIFDAGLDEDSFDFQEDEDFFEDDEEV